MKIATVVLLTLLALFNRCERPPVKQDIPPHGNAAEHTGTMHEEMQNSPGAANAPYELQFLDTMIVHHQGAIDMAQLVATRAQHPELKQLAKNIIADQQKETDKMKSWRQQWFSSAEQAVNMDLPGMSQGMADMNLDRLDELKENEFDLEFIRQMIPHHEGAVTMAKDLLAHQPRAELRTLAENIIDSQQGEINQMREWEKEWSKK